MREEDLPRGRSSNTPPPGTADQRQRGHFEPPPQTGGVPVWNGPATLPTPPTLMEVAATVVRRAREVENLIQRLEAVALGTCGGDGSTAACQPGPDSIAELMRLADVSYGVCAQRLHSILERLETPHSAPPRAAEGCR